MWLLCLPLEVAWNHQSTSPNCQVWFCWFFAFFVCFFIPDMFYLCLFCLFQRNTFFVRVFLFFSLSLNSKIIPLQSLSESPPPPKTSVAVDSPPSPQFCFKEGAERNGDFLSTCPLLRKRCCCCCMLGNMLVLPQQHTVRFPLIQQRHKKRKKIKKKLQVTGMIVLSAHFTHPPFSSSSSRTVFAVFKEEKVENKRNKPPLWAVFLSFLVELDSLADVQM